MSTGMPRFEFYLNQLETKLSEATLQKDPALWLYQSGARTPIFMLEGLAKLYGEIHNKKRFGKIEEQFKRLEDSLGVIDYYDNFAKDIAKEKATNTSIASELEAKAQEQAATLNKLLIDKRWIGKGANRITKIRSQLEKADWLSSKREVAEIEAAYKNSIKKIKAFASDHVDGFTDLETQVHELRRKLRWLSIYPQALQGCIQLTTKASGDKAVKKYLTPEIVNSPFNKLPKVGTNKYVLLLNKDYFLSLSWMIAELGRLKDNGLRIAVMREVGRTHKSDAVTEVKILADATAICQTFFTENSLDKLISGIVKVEMA